MSLNPERPVFSLDLKDPALRQVFIFYFANQINLAMSSDLRNTPELFQLMKAFALFYGGNADLYDKNTDEDEKEDNDGTDIASNDVSAGVPTASRSGNIGVVGYVNSYLLLAFPESALQSENLNSNQVGREKLILQISTFISNIVVLFSIHPSLSKNISQVLDRLRKCN